VSSNKVWVIDPVKSREGKSDAAMRGQERTIYSPDDTAQSPGARKRHEGEQMNENGSPILTLLAYLAGPYTILTTRRGRESRLWVVLAIISGIAAASIAARASRIFTAPSGTGIGYIIWLSIACIAAFMGFAAWARGVALLGRHKGWLLGRLPAPVRHPSTAWIFGLAIPGFGLFVAGHAKRAACALCTTCALVVCALIFWRAPELWRLSQAGILKGHGDALEHVFIALGAVALFGVIAWIVQALDGARLAGLRNDDAPQPHGDWAAVALVAAIVALLVTVKPARIAETVDRLAISLREDGLRVIPLHAVQAAMRLDPSRPEYALQAIQINEALGRPGEALKLRRDLAERWKSYERMLRLEAAVIENAVLRPANP